jgi:hypothetical protein
MIKASAVVLLASVLSAILSAAPSALRCLENESSIEIRHGENLVLRYNKVPTADAAKNEAVYSRTGYIHPLCTPSGKVITGDYAPDHPHQHGLFFAWTKTAFEGRAPEFWNQKLAAGTVSYVKTLQVISTPEEAGFDVEHRFDDLTAGEAPKPALLETWRVRVRVVEGRFVIDLSSSQRTAGESLLTIEKYHYGGMAIRGNAAWLDEEPGRIVTSEGHDRVAGNHTRPTWIKMAGLLDGAPCGIVAIPHPENFRAPQWVRLHPSKPYFVFSPMVEEPFKIEPGKPYLSRFRFVVYDGEVGDAEVERAFDKW